MPEKYKCPGCQQFKDSSEFNCRPSDQRCNVCLPADVAMVAFERNAELAGKKVAAIFDKVETAKSLGPVERLIQAGYEQWGGEQQFMHDWVACVKNLMDANKHHAAAQNMMSFLKLHAKVDHMRMEDDWRNMDDDKVEARLKQRMATLMAKMEADKVIEGTFSNSIIANTPVPADY